MKVKILSDRDGEYGYPKNLITTAERIVKSFCDCATDMELVNFLNKQEVEKSLDFVADAWGLDYEIVPDQKIRKCAVCGKPVTSGYLFDGTTCLCDRECAEKFFDFDDKCVDILIDNGDRLIWHDEFPQQIHYRANVGMRCREDFKYFDNEDKMYKWISSRIGEDMRNLIDCIKWSEKHPKTKIEVFSFTDVKHFYVIRRDYLQSLRKLDDTITKAQRLPKCLKRDILFKKIDMYYEDAYRCLDFEDAVWQGEV